MPNIPPPAGGLPQPAFVRAISVGPEVWRLHSANRPANAMNPTPQPSVDDGGRFDSLDGSYSYIYLGDSPEAAIAETLCRDLPLDGQARVVQAKRLDSRRLTKMTITTAVPCAALHGAHLSRVGQDLWLTKCDARDYAQTRAWAAAILTATPSASGLAYRCRHDEDRTAWMLAGDPTAPTHPALWVHDEESIDLSSVGGRALVATVLQNHSAVLSSSEIQR